MATFLFQSQSDKMFEEMAPYIGVRYRELSAIKHVRYKEV